MAGGRRLRALGWVQAALERGRGDLPVAGLGVGRASHEHAKSPRRKKGQDLLLQLNRRQRDFGFHEFASCCEGGRLRADRGERLRIRRLRRFWPPSKQFGAAEGDPGIWFEAPRALRYSALRDAVGDKPGGWAIRVVM